MSTERDAELLALGSKLYRIEALGSIADGAGPNGGLLAVTEAAWDEGVAAAKTAAWMPYEFGIGWESSVKAIDTLTNPYRPSVTVDKETKK